MLAGTPALEPKVPDSQRGWLRHNLYFLSEEELSRHKDTFPVSEH